MRAEAWESCGQPVSIKRGNAKRYRRALCWSRVGLGLLIAGFLLQIASNHAGARAPAGGPPASSSQAAN